MAEGLTEIADKVVVMRKFYKSELENFMPIFNSEVEQVLPDNYWQILNSYRNREVCTHTINVLYRTMRDPLYLECNQYE